ncbi:polymer-forming cytoskeletal protein [Clostridium niameyense]|uniref:Polymer-forming cytoskeletal protein n=1 Tax=Clostridium niameyense TaxID=1622073 RepID=A0A6M0R955_9CLOT|nr:polymer-forming cytoskeletal protein [Clostridium niameyense]NEZ46783.1 polymer-forming cytoskeletal protein [Clostridium niameyense]
MKRYYKFILSLIIFLIIPICNVKASSPNYVVTEGIIKFGENIYIQPGQIESTDVIGFGGDIYINGIVHGNVKSIGGNVYINGNVDGDVVSFGGKITTGPKGKVNGKIKEKFKNMNLPFLRKNSIYNMTDYKFHYSRIASVILLGILCIVVYNLIPYNELKMASSLDKSLGKSLLYGYIFMILTPVIIMTLIFSIVGIILIPVVLLIIMGIFIIGFTALCLFLGKRLLKSRVSPIVSILIGIIFYELIRSIVFIGLGKLIVSLFIVPLSIGLAIKTKFGSLRPWRRIDNDNWN